MMKTLKRFPEKLIDFSIKKTRQNNKLEKKCDSRKSRFALSATLALAAAATLAGCSAGVSVGSATYNADERGSTYCSRSVGASIEAPDTSGSGVHRQRGCVTRPADGGED
ncbi:hypothetical protein FZC33_14335 [Labrys sp. KNU-23]|uniref:hypothetical protein n=1 Tax=Labrys sp. KNU-23 TaxID=2789216 RepID=UPI0011F069AE|nr:hypothetical protein [Labrys sp. KNU-23]QEN87432.1 hypothetical protein FZC33_14335 [Labrys sp. KNU-23]